MRETRYDGEPALVSFLSLPAHLPSLRITLGMALAQAGSPGGPRLHC